MVKESLLKLAVKIPRLIELLRMSEEIESIENIIQHKETPIFRDFQVVYKLFFEKIGKSRRFHKILASIGKIKDSILKDQLSNLIWNFVAEECTEPFAKKFTELKSVG